MRLLVLLVFAFACAAVAGTFAASGEIRGDEEGIGNIATWQRTNRRTAIFDAGGFSANSEAQNFAVCSLMQGVNYSAIAMGYAELRFSAGFWESANQRFKLPLLATNVKSPKTIFERVRTAQNEMKRNSDKFAIIAIVGKNDEVHADYEIECPREALNLVLPQIPNDFIIVLIGHCEPSLLDSLMNEFPRISFGVQGHSKIGTEPSRMVGHKRVLQFGGANKIAILDRKGRARWREFFRRASAPAPTQTQTIAARPVIPIEIFAMSDCSYSKDAVRDFLPLMSDEKFSVKISFIGDYHEEKIWLAVQDLFPERFRDFLFLALSADKNEYMKIAESVGLTLENFEIWNTKKYKKSQMLNINEVPTIMVDNQITNMSPQNVIRNLCHLTNNTKCYGLADTINVKLILTNYKTPNLPVNLVLQSIERPLTTILTDTLNFDDLKAQELLKRFAIERLPAIVADDVAWNWGEIPDGVYYKRDFSEGQIVIIADNTTTDVIRDFIRENLQYLQNWHILTDNEADGWLIWHDNRNLVSGKNILDAKTLLKYYGK